MNEYEVQINLYLTFNLEEGLSNEEVTMRVKEYLNSIACSDEVKKIFSDGDVIDIY